MLAGAPMRSRPLDGARICVIVTAPRSAAFYAGQLVALREAGADVLFVSGPADEVAEQCRREGAQYAPVAMERAPAAIADARALASLLGILRRVRPDIVNAGTPKAGLLGMLAATAARVPRRVHTLHGLRYEAATGAARRALWLAQHASCRLATDIVCVSHSLHERAIETGLIPANQGRVVGDGSVNGVDVAAFSRTSHSTIRAAELRRTLGIPPEAKVVGYIGRLSRDKGVRTLAQAWLQLSAPGRFLMVAGEVDPTDPPERDVLERLRDAPDVRLVGHLNATTEFYAAVDVVALPTVREGMPTVPLEASAMELPVVASRATGCVDAVVDGATGRLVPIGDADALASAIDRYLRDPHLCAEHGRAGRARVVARFTTTRVHGLMIEYYADLLRRSCP